MNRNFARLTGKKLRFYVQDVRIASTHAYLQTNNQAAWLDLPRRQRLCGSGDPFISNIAIANNVPDVINVYVGGEAGTSCGMGLVWATPAEQHVFMTPNHLNPNVNNRNEAYNFGPDILVHEFGHFLSLLHTHEGGCGSVVDDTPRELPLDTAHGHTVLTAFCEGIIGDCAQNPDTFDSCPGDLGFDNVYNYMSYTGPGCYRLFSTQQIQAIGGFLTTSVTGLVANSRDLGRCPILTPARWLASFVLSVLRAPLVSLSSTSTMLRTTKASLLELHTVWAGLMRL
eukprot:Plantae.Rhodophyta-Rhodochaete_pulchella.ctg20485.p1 GENE.Plantae.Rhodophyta-Rhodochaete_pulchella.ctg20485~~Plantae.Rhodophyta-Rhodochaete_pulchella.ctg20485.p1  ORF type:complete len:284 (-),score=25.37 Plantae.Rhodophyta-Rhodochaete_pulchella.ctg20485:753-1604(-)